MLLALQSLSCWAPALICAATPFACDLGEASMAGKCLPDGVPDLHCADACTDADVCIFFVGSSQINYHSTMGSDNSYSMWSAVTESEGLDRRDLLLPSNQDELIKVAGELGCSSAMWPVVHQPASTQLTPSC